MTANSGLVREKRERIRVTHPSSDGSDCKVVQSEKEKTDVNYIMSRAVRTGVLEGARHHPGQYIDLADAPTFHEALNVVRRAEESFNELPAEVRKRFANNPMEMLAFLDDPANIDEAVSLGMVENVREADAPSSPKKRSSSSNAADAPGDAENAGAKPPSAEQ